MECYVIGKKKLGVYMFVTLIQNNDNVLKLKCLQFKFSFSDIRHLCTVLPSDTFY
jgi:hypothetical protein